jgi:NAD(P)H-dependent glutamate synthase small subunit
MAKPTGFLEFSRVEPPKRDVEERVEDYSEVEQLLEQEQLNSQAARCMDCGVPFCHNIGCPLGNIIPEWNDMIYRGKWRRALALLEATNNLPEVTGRICPAPCEAACTLSINDESVTIKQIELQIAERGWEEGWIQPEPAPVSTGRRVAVVGSGPAGLAAAQQLARAGHEVVLFEQHDRIGGILRYGIPDFKLEKWVIDRRLEQMKAEGVILEPHVRVGDDISTRYLERKFDATFLATGARVPRSLDVPGADAGGIHFAMDFLTQQNRVNAGEVIPPESRISAEGKHVVVIGGGDTGSDCVGTSVRQGAESIVQVELLPKPPEQRPGDNPWPQWPMVLRTSSSHQEGCKRLWSVLTREVIKDEDGNVEALRCVELEWNKPEGGGRAQFTEVPGSEFTLQADLVLLAMGFLHVEQGPLVSDLGLEVDERRNIVVGDGYMSSKRGVFAAGDCVTGASLVVRAISLGRQVAAAVDVYLNEL